MTNKLLKAEIHFSGRESDTALSLFVLIGHFLIKISLISIYRNSPQTNLISHRVSCFLFSVLSWHCCGTSKAYDRFYKIKNINPAAAAMATQSNKLGKCITPIHLDRLLPAKMDHIISPSQCS